MAWTTCILHCNGVEYFAYKSHVCFATTDLEKISASLWAPTHHPTPIPVQPLAVSNPDKENDNLDADDSGEDTKQEWLDESHFTELTLRFPSSVSEAMAIEVHQLFFFFYLDL